MEVTAIIGNNTATSVSEAEGLYVVTFVHLSEVVATSGDTVEVLVIRQTTGEFARQTIQLSSEQIIAHRAWIDVQFFVAEFLLSVPAGISLIHVPLKVTAVDGEPKTIESVGDLYDALGGANTVNLLITYNTQTERWNSYLGDEPEVAPLTRR